MATPTINPEWESKKQKAKELIAAGGCYAIQFWSRTDADRLCPEELKKFEPLEGMVYVHEWIDTAKKAIELIQQGVSLLSNHSDGANV